MEEGKKKKYSCNECSYTTNGPTDIKRHLRVHSGEKPYNCALCEKSFVSPGNRNRHQLTHSKEKRFQCDICLVRFSEKGTLTKHKRLHTGEKLFECEICGKKFYQKGSLNDHLALHNGEKRYFCPTCGKGFRHKAYLEEHSFSHEKRQFPCSECDMVFNSVGSFRKHIRIIHENKKISCKVCGEEFTRSENCNTHMKTVHHLENIYKCKVCGETFESRYTLNKHRVIHKNENPYQCSECGNMFETKESLRHHIREYRVEFYCCPHCNIGFISRSHLDKHWVMHRGQPGVCKICKEVFPTKTALSFHKHSDAVLEKNWHCPYCAKNFLMKKSLIRHVKSLHPSIVEDDQEVSSSDLQRDFQCSVCTKTFFSEKYLVWHRIFLHGLLQPVELFFKAKSSANVTAASGNTDILESKSDDSENESTDMIPSQENDDDVDTNDSTFPSSIVYIKEEKIDYEEPVESQRMCDKEVESDPSVVEFTSVIKEFIDNIKKEHDDVC